MAKTKVKTAYFCQNCGAQHPKWQGQCSTCKEWNTIVEEVVSKGIEKTSWNKEPQKRANTAQKINEISLN